jgi:hypothetical protein
MSLREEIERAIQAKLMGAQGVERAMLEGHPVGVSEQEWIQVIGLNFIAIKEAIGQLADEIDDLRSRL